MFTRAEQLKQEGNRLAGEGKFQEALKKYEQAIEADANFAIAWKRRYAYET